MEREAGLHPHLPLQPGHRTQGNLPRLSKKILDNLLLQKRGTGGVDAAAVRTTFDISNLARLGESEVQLVQNVIDGVKYLIACDKRLERDQDIQIPAPISQFR